MAGSIWLREKSIIPWYLSQTQLTVGVRSGNDFFTILTYNLVY
jgi:hypothetical protein